MRNSKVFGIIYIATNKLNSKVYVGQTTKGLATRIKGHLLKSKNPFSGKKHSEETKERIRKSLAKFRSENK